MGTLLIQHNAHSSIAHLQASVIVGRDRSLRMTRINDTRVPNFWLEIRYINHEWCWRVLNGEHTRGMGKILKNGWRKLSGKIRLGNHICVELLDNRPPQNLVYDIEQKIAFPLQDLPDIQINEAGLFLDSLDEPLQDGMEVFVESLNRTVEIWINQPVVTTQDSVLSFGEHCFLSCNLDTLSLQISDASQEISHQGEGARLIYAYMLARIDNSDGWMNSEEAFKEWLGLGGNPDSEVTRIKWERNKLCNRLFELGVMNASNLFEKKRVGTQWYHRISLPESQLEIKS